jgi:hypothetical protein
MLAVRGTTLGMELSLSTIVNDPAAFTGGKAVEAGLCATWMLH